MATLKVKFHTNSVEIISQVFCCTIHDTWENRQVWFVILRSLRSPTTGKPLLSYQGIAEAFSYTARQNINNYVREYEACDENFVDYLRHQRKVDPGVVNAVRDELGKDVLATTGVLCTRVNQQLGRSDLSCANIRVALEQIPCTVIRAAVLRDIAHGAFSPKEEVVLAELFAAIESYERGGRRRPGEASRARRVPVSVDGGLAVRSEAHREHEADRPESREVVAPVSPLSGPASGKLARYATLASQAGLEAMPESPDRAIIQTTQTACVDALLTPKLPLSEIPEPVARMVKAMALYASGASFSQLGRWFGGKAKSTMYTWVLGLALAVWPVLRGWVWTHVKGKRQYVDEKWLKIRHTWHCLFVSLDDASGLPVVHALLPTRTQWACRLFVLKLKRPGKIPAVIITDGLQGYVSAIAHVFPAARHLVCLFHHQQSVTRCVNQQFGESERKEAKAATTRMKRVVQTHDTRTVRRRLERLEHTANEKGWTIMGWIQRTRDKLNHLVPAIRSNTYPSTTDEIERFFRAFTRFYKTRCGFHSVTSAKRQSIVFLVVYLFTIQAERGKAPIENILPEANTMPFYRLLNYPFAIERTSHPPPQHVKPTEEIATELAEEVV